jgi:hypothetical protein
MSNAALRTVMGVVACAGLGLGLWLSPARNEARQEEPDTFGATQEQPFTFEATAEVVLKALQEEDWETVSRHCLDHVSYFVYRRIYVSTAARRGGPMHEADMLFTNDDIRYYRVNRFEFRMYTHPTDERMSDVDRRLFRTFCQLVNRTREYYAHGMSIRTLGADPDIPVHDGPSISGEIASNAQWRVDFVQTDDGWRVSTFIVGVR